MAWDRTERTEALLREKIAIIVLERLNDPRLGFVTITGAKLSKDKRQCKVLYTVLGTPVQRRLSEQALRDAAPHIQQVLAPTMRLRTLPELRFVYDESIEKGSRMLGILDELAKEHPGEPAASGPQDTEPPPDGGQEPEPRPQDG
jgi:ribosome-binding factor A